MKLNRGLSISITILLFISIIFTKDALSWPGATHKILSNHAALRSASNQNDYFGKYLGFKNGLEESFTWGKTQRAIEWLQEGSHLEDEGLTRSYNHFHNPLKEWANAGLDDYLQLGFHLKGESALLWAQDGDTQSTFPGGDWSWKAIRDIYYVALVSAAEKDRQAYFAILFRGLGHQMHLIQDMAVPSHARNDAHPEQSLLVYNEYDELFFEPWAARNPGFINNQAKNPRYPTVSLNTKINNYVPITQLTDANQYGGSNPSASTAIGLAEYTNANFFSDDTIFASEIYPANHWHYFPYPNKSSTDLQTYLNGGKILETIIAKDGVSDTGIWLSKTGDGEQIAHFVRTTYLSKLYYLLFGEGSLFYGTFYRDDVCHADYAAQLVPRAVGYSAGVLDYFLRGKIDMAEDKDAGGYVIKNDSDEDMNGTFELYYDDATDNQRKQCWSGSFALGALSSGNNKSDTITFTPPNDAKEPNKYILVFQGKLGNEDGAVVGALVSLTSSSFVLVVQKHLKMLDGKTLTQEFGGEFIGLKAGGGHGNLNDMVKGLEIGFPSLGRAYVNGIEITDRKWTHQNWFTSTGVPSTWKIELVGKANATEIRIRYIEDGKELFNYKIDMLRYSSYSYQYNEEELSLYVENYAECTCYRNGNPHYCEVDYYADGVVEKNFYISFSAKLNGSIFTGVGAEGFFKSNALPASQLPGNTDGNLTYYGWDTLTSQELCSPCDPYWAFDDASCPSGCKMFLVSSIAPDEVDWGYIRKGERRSWRAYALGFNSSYSKVDNNLESVCWHECLDCIKNKGPSICVAKVEGPEDHGHPRPAQLSIKVSVIGTFLESYFNEKGFDKEEYPVGIDYGPGIDPRVL